MILAEFVFLSMSLAPGAVTNDVSATSTKQDAPGATSKKSGKTIATTAGLTAGISSQSLLKASHAFMLVAVVGATLGTFAMAKHAHYRDNPLSIGWQLAEIHDLIPAAEGGDLDAQYKIAMEYQGIGEVTNSMRWLQRAAEKGHVESANGLAVLLVMVQHDYAAAVPWLKKAADLGSAGAQNNLGICYVNGSGVMQDYGQAAQYFLLAAKQGYLPAEKALANMYQQGAGVNPDKLEAYRWLKKASLQGDPEADGRLQALAATMTPEQIAEANKPLLQP
jgi:hypothetical protein